MIMMMRLVLVIMIMNSDLKDDDYNDDSSVADEINVKFKTGTLTIHMYSLYIDEILKIEKC